MDVEPPQDLWDLERLARARTLTAWMFERLVGTAAGRVAEVGAGIGTFSAPLLASPGVESLLLLEPDVHCVGVLGERFGGDPRVTIAAEGIPGSAALRGASFDLVVCQNVLEHIEDHAAALGELRDALDPRGRLALLVPAHPKLFGALDRTYGHYRRYTREGLRRLLVENGFAVDDLRSFNLLGVPGWWVAGRSQGDARIGEGSLRVYEALVRAWRPLENRVRVPWGLSLIAQARRA